MEDKNRSLMWHGMFLFLLGLISGFVEQKFVNPRMGLAAHLEGVMLGTFLIALGAVWSYVKLSSGMKTVAYWAALYGAYVNWATTALAAALGTFALSPITGAGHHGEPWQESLITALFMSVGIATLAFNPAGAMGISATLRPATEPGKTKPPAAPAVVSAQNIKLRYI